MSAMPNSPATASASVARPQGQPAVRGIGLSRLIGVELRKMFDTRAGFWLMASIVILAAFATLMVILFAPETQLSFGTFAAAVGMPTSVLLPCVAILSVTGEWTQRSGLTTFALVPSRGKVLLAKWIAIVGIGIVSMLVAMGIGALGNILGSAINGVDTVWMFTFPEGVNVTLGNVIGMLMGFMLGVLTRNSAAAIVGYFVYAFVIPTISGILMATQEWFRDIQRWVDLPFNVYRLFDTAMTAQDWRYLGVTCLFWIVLPTLVGVRRALRAEIK